MELTMIPYFGLIWTGIGFLFMLIGFFVLAYHESEEADYTGIENNQAQELFAYFLEEEEKKNDALRQSVEAVKQWQEVDKTSKMGKEDNQGQQIPSVLSKSKEEVLKPNKSNDETKLYEEIIRLYEAGTEVEDIAKKLNKGKGEVQLMLSLYSMR